MSLGTIVIELHEFDNNKKKNIVSWIQCGSMVLSFISCHRFYVNFKTARTEIIYG